MDRDSIQHVVFGVLQTLVPRNTQIRARDRLIEDLQLTSDDATAMAIELEARFNASVHPTRWRTVFTVEDVIEVFNR